MLTKGSTLTTLSAAELISLTDMRWNKAGIPTVQAEGIQITHQGVHIPTRQGQRRVQQPML